jgi:hypothetical protein
VAGSRLRHAVSGKSIGKGQEQGTSTLGVDVRKIMTVTMEFDLGDRRTHLARLKSGYEAAASAATAAVERELLEGSVATVRTRMSYDYRYFGVAAEQTESVDDEVEDEDAPL